MPTKFTATVSFQGSDGSIVKRSFDLQELNGADAGADFLTAQGIMTDLVNALTPLTDAFIINYSLGFKQDYAGAVPANVNLVDTVNGIIYTTKIKTNGLHNTAVQNVPAVAIGIMQGATGEDRNRLDLGNADWQTYVAELADHFLVSDGENVDTSIGTAGTKEGYRVAKAKNYNT